MMNDELIKLRVEQIKSVHSHTFSGVFGSSIAAFLLTFILWDIVDQTQISTWLSVIIMLQLIRLVPFFMIKNTSNKDEILKWDRPYLFIFLLMGLGWGATAVFFFPENQPFYNLVIAIWLLGLMSTASAYVAYFPVVFAFMLPMLIPLVIRCFSIADSFHLSLGVALCIYALAMLPTWKRINKSWIDSVMLNTKLEKAMAEIKTLKGIIPICANCKNIRDDKGFWNQLEAFITKHSDAEFSHGICPDCKLELYPDLEIGKK